MRYTWRGRIVNHIQENSSLYVFVTVLLLMGVIFGAVLVNSLQISQKQDLYFYLNRFFGQVAAGQFADAKDMFQESYFSHVKYVGLIWLLGISVIGLPLIFIMLFLKGVVVGFTVGFLVSQLGWKGFLLGVTTILPQNIILIPVYIVMTTLASHFSLRLVRHQFIKRSHKPLRPLLLQYTGVFLVLGLLLLLASGIESFISPTLMKEVMKISVK